MPDRKISDEGEKDGMREGRSWAMDSLRSCLETGNGIPHDAWEEARKR